MKRTHLSTLFISTTLASLVAAPSFGQGLLEEVVVTAEKREASLSDTPIAITALTSDQLNALGINTQQEIANFTPSMSYQESAGGGEGNKIYLRGIGRETSSTGTEPGVGVYLNGFYTNESGVLQGSPDIIERIEILRGPQGTLFGRNTTGGAINVVTKKPGEEMENVLRGRLSNYNGFSAGFTSSGPITDNVGYLVHYSHAQADSFFENVSGPDPIGLDSDTVEAQIDVDFSDRLNWNLRYFSASFENETLERAKIGGYRNEPGAPSKLGEIVINPEVFALLPVAPAASDPFKLSSDFQGRVAVDDQVTFHSTMTLDLDGLTIKMLNGYQDYSWFGQKDFDGTVSPVSYIESIGQAERNEQHEIQFISAGDGPIDWVVGLFYLKNNSNQPYTLTDANNPFLINNLSGVDNPTGVFYHQLGDVEATSKAIYSQATWNVSDSFALTVGARYSEDEKIGFEEQEVYYDSVVDAPFCTEAGFAELVANNDPYGTPTGCTRLAVQLSQGEATHKADWDAVNWRINASWFLSDEHMVYGTVATGYKPGGFRLGGLQDDPATPENESIVANEELNSLEIGYKGGIADVLKVSAAVFYYDYQDIQVELGILDPNTGIVTSKLDNASSTDVYGLEVESSWAINDQLTLLANYSYLKSEYKDDFFVSDNKDNIVENVKGNELNRTPNHKATLAAYYTQALEGGDLVFTGNFSFIDDQYMTVFNDAVETVDSYTQLNGRISWYPNSGNYELALFGNNITDELSFANDLGVSSLRDGNRTTARPISPRVFGLEAVLYF